MGIPKINWGRVLLLIVGGTLIAFLFFQAFTLGIRIKSAWAEIQFAYDKPHLVRVVREDYTEKQQKIEASFLEKQKSAEDQLIEEVVRQLKDEEASK